MNPSLRNVWITVAAAFALWFVTFAVPVGNFWVKITCSASLLAAVGLISSRRELKTLFAFKWSHVVVGVVAALVLYGVFAIGKVVSSYMFSFAPGQIQSVYATKTQLHPVVIGLLLVFVMGPAEEIYWRGFVQRVLVERYGAWAGVLGAAAIYTLVHVVSWNFMLVVAAAVCGLFWGVLFHRQKNLIPLIISHSLWDLTIFVLFPMT